jgi:hypothetical protein
MHRPFRCVRDVPRRSPAVVNGRDMGGAALPSVAAKHVTKQRAVESVPGQDVSGHPTGGPYGDPFPSVPRQNPKRPIQFVERFLRVRATQAQNESYKFGSAVMLCIAAERDPGR